MIAAHALSVRFGSSKIHLSRPCESVAPFHQLGEIRSDQAILPGLRGSYIKRGRAKKFPIEARRLHSIAFVRRLPNLPSSLFASLALTLAATGATSSSGCGDDPPPFNEGGGGSASSGATSGAGGEGGVFVDNGPDLFAALEPDLVAACAGCHEPGGIGDAPFLATPDRYESIMSWPDIVVREPQQSVLLTYAVTGAGHSGTNLDSAPNDLLGRVEEWLTVESKAIADTPVEQIGVDPITPILGFNALYLDGLGKEYEGLALTFTAAKLTENSLKLDNLTVYTTSSTGVHLVHPVFAVYPKGKPADPDPVDSFSELDERYAEGTANTLGVGMLILTNWQENAKLGIGFGLIEPYVAGGGEGGGGGAGGGGSTGGPCSAQNEFNQFASPQLQQRCGGCHGGNNGGATGAMDISKLQSDPSNACGQVLNRVNLGTPNQSQLFVVTDPGGNASHPYKFGGNAANFNTFRDEITKWINVE